MRVFSNTPSADFIARLRQAAITAKLGPLVIDQIDQLGDVDDLNAQLEAAQDGLGEMTEDRDALREELQALLDVVDNIAPADFTEALVDAQKIASRALERHSK